jgi:hypothetical protein
MDERVPNAHHYGSSLSNLDDAPHSIEIGRIHCPVAFGTLLAK